MNDADAKPDGLQFLPHGPEFRFLDSILSLTPGKEGAGEYRVRGDEVFLRGHFPGDPIMPGVLLIEAVAQLAGVVAQSDLALAPLAGLKLTALRGVKILGAARPGDVVRLEATIIARLDNLVQAEVRGWVADVLVLKGELTLSGDASPTLHPKNARMAAPDSVEP
jgi:3-hydroxyacyl-[acyl-carrier-protein] dehydratase